MIAHVLNDTSSLDDSSSSWNADSDVSCGTRALYDRLEGTIIIFPTQRAYIGNEETQ